MKSLFYAASTAALSMITLGAVSLSMPATGAWAQDALVPISASLLPASVIEEAAREGQTPAYPLPDLSETQPAQPLIKPVRTGASLAELVATFGGNIAPDRESECLAVAVYHESKGEPLSGQLAVAKTVINRARSGRFPSSLCGVVLQKSQFSFVRGGTLPTVARGSAAWRNAVAITHIAQNDLADSGVGSALFFHARYVSPGWKLRRIGAVGNHIFYR